MTDLGIESTLTAAMASGDWSEIIACALVETNKTECSYCKFAYTSSSQYTATWASYKWTTTAPTLTNIATTAISTPISGLTINGAADTQPATGWGAAVSIT